MKTIYTDEVGILPWLMLLAAGTAFWRAYEGFNQGDGNQLGLGIGSGAVFVILALKRLWDVRQAKRDGRDPTIISIKHDR